MKRMLLSLWVLLLSFLMLGSVFLNVLAAGSEADQDATTTATDSAAGTLRYTPAADGKTVTISYEVAGETVSYTVPNRENYLSGGFAAVDDLGRSLYDSEAVGSYKAEERYVGLFYFLWHGEHRDPGIYDLQKIIDEIGIEAADNEDCGRYAAVHEMHWFASRCTATTMQTTLGSTASTPSL